MASRSDRFHRWTCSATFAAGAALQASAAGTWVALPAAPHQSGGGFSLLSDGTVLCKSNWDSPANASGYGNVYDRLTPDSQGRYRTGTWSSIAPMINTRLYYSSQLLRDGRVYVAGGEYGTGIAAGEVYDPVANAWTATPSPGANVSDANSEILGDGRVLQALVAGTLRSTVIWNPATNTYSAGPSCVGIHNESAWVKLRDGSVLMVDRNSTASERYRPTTNTWVSDAAVPVPLYDVYGLETGGALLLPDGRAFFLGSTGNTAYYTPGVGGANGSWAAGPVVPGPLGAPDAPMAMLPNGKILCAVSPIPTSSTHFPTPTSFFEFDPASNAWTQINAPTGALTHNSPAFVWTFIALPDGTTLCARQGSSQYWAYVPDGTPLAAAKPSVTKLTRSGTTVTLTGLQFNGLNEGASYGDDWQMNTNYPIVRLANSAGTVWTARTFGWSSTGVQTGATAVTTQLTVPAAMPAGTYSLFVTANGVASSAWTYWNPKSTCPADLNLDNLVNGADLGTLLSAWGMPGASNGSGDLSGDGIVQGDDLGMLLAAWGSCPP